MEKKLELAGLSVLILEDDFFQADNARRVLERAGARVVGTFAEVEPSIRAMRTERPDCALFDINLGAGPSFEAAREAQAMGIPIIFMTGYDQQVVAPEFAQIERLQKPMPEGKLVAAVSRHCRTG